MITLLRNLQLHKSPSVVVLAILVLITLFSPVDVAAQDPFDAVCSETPSAEVCSDRLAPVVGEGGAFETIARVLTFIAGGIAVIIVLIGGLRYVISAGDPNAAQSARQTIVYGLVGLVVVMISYAILDFVADAIG